MKPLAKLSRFFSRVPLHLAVILMCVLWIIPTLGLFVTSFRSRQAVATTGWWQTFLPQPQAVGKPQYTQYCSACHGANGKTLPAADLSSPTLVNQYPSAASLLLMLRKPVNGAPHLPKTPLPTTPHRRVEYPDPDCDVPANPFRPGPKYQPADH